MKRQQALVALGLAGVLAWPAPGRADVEAELRRELVGRTVVVRQDLVSECTDHYTDVEVLGNRIAGGRGERFAAGELARIDNVHVGWSRFAVNLSLVEPYRISWSDGPFTLHEQRTCRVQLDFDLPREARKDRVRSLAAITAVVEPFADEASARRSAAYNRRRVEPLPADWEEIRRAHARWSAERVNAAVRVKVERLLEEAAGVLTYMPDDAGYLESFGLGARARRSESWSSCESMLDASFYVSGSGGRDKRGFADGQHVAWATRLAAALAECYVEPPS